VRRASSPPDTLADGIAVKDPSALTHRLLRRHVDDFLLVDEEPIEDAVNALLEYEKTVVEGAGAASLAALMAHPTRFKGKRVGCILSGGNIDSHVLADTILRGLARSGRLCRVRLALRDLPGALARIAAVVAQEGGNIVDIRHQRVFSGARERTEVEIELATRDRRHARRVFRALHAAGYPAKTPD
jgi:threonine dehydratase